MMEIFLAPSEHWVRAPSPAVSSQSAPVVSPHSALFPATVSEDGAVAVVRSELSEGFKVWPTKTVFRNTTWSWLSPSFLSRAGWDCQAIHQAVPTELAPLPGSKSSGKLVVVGINLVPGENPLPFPSSISCERMKVLCSTSGCAVSRQELSWPEVS